MLISQEENGFKKIRITGIKEIDPITVYYEDFDVGQGQIVIICYDKVWFSFWGAMGDYGILEFFLDSGVDYIAKNLSKIKPTVPDFDKISSDVGSDVSEENYQAFYSEVLDLYGSPPDLPEIPNHEFVYLCKIIETVQSAIKVKKGQE